MRAKLLNNELNESYKDIQWIKKLYIFLIKHYINKWADMVYNDLNDLNPNEFSEKYLEFAESIKKGQSIFLEIYLTKRKFPKIRENLKVNFGFSNASNLTLKNKIPTVLLHYNIGLKTLEFFNIDENIKKQLKINEYEKSKSELIQEFLYDLMDRYHIKGTEHGLHELSHLWNYIQSKGSTFDIFAKPLKQMAKDEFGFEKEYHNPEEIEAWLISSAEDIIDKELPENFDDFLNKIFRRNSEFLFGMNEKNRKLFIKKASKYWQEAKPKLDFSRKIFKNIFGGKEKFSYLTPREKRKFINITDKYWSKVKNN